MEISVVGIAKKSFVPDVVEIGFRFKRVGKTYEDAVNGGASAVKKFAEFLGKFGFKKDELKTTNFSVRENQVYDNKTNKYKKDGFSFEQGINLKFDYDVARFAKIIDEISTLDAPPEYRVGFKLGDEAAAKRALYEKAVADAKEQAQMIAKASGLALKECKSVSANPFGEIGASATNFGSGASVLRCASYLSDDIENTFVPSDITVECELGVVWQAE